jgi:hypothetical protein
MDVSFGGGSSSRALAGRFPSDSGSVGPAPKRDPMVLAQHKRKRADLATGSKFD